MCSLQFFIVLTYSLSTSKLLHKNQSLSQIFFFFIFVRFIVEIVADYYENYERINDEAKNITGEVATRKSI